MFDDFLYAFFWGGGGTASKSEDYVILFFPGISFLL